MVFLAWMEWLPLGTLGTCLGGGNLWGYMTVVDAFLGVVSVLVHVRGLAFLLSFGDVLYCQLAAQIYHQIRYTARLSIC